MAERLTKHGKTTHENGICCTHFSGEECVKLQGDCSNGCLWEEKVWEKLAHYEDLEEQGRLIKLPCKIGDTVYGTRRWHGTKIAKAGTVSEMFYTQEGKLMIVVKYVCRGYWGEKIFATLEEAEAALKGAEE